MKDKKEPTYFIKDDASTSQLPDMSSTVSAIHVGYPEPEKIVCPKCGKEALVDTSIVLTSYPPQYSYHCPYCDTNGYIYCHELNAHKKVIQKCLICGEEKETIGATEISYVCDKCKAAVMVARKIHGIN